MLQKRNTKAYQRRRTNCSVFPANFANTTLQLDATSKIVISSHISSATLKRPDFRELSDGIGDCTKITNSRTSSLSSNDHALHRLSLACRCNSSNFAFFSAANQFCPHEAVCSFLRQSIRAIHTWSLLLNHARTWNPINRSQHQQCTFKSITALNCVLSILDQKVCCVSNIVSITTIAQQLTFPHAHSDFNNALFL